MSLVGWVWAVRQYFKYLKTLKMYLCSPVSDRAVPLGGFKIPPFVLGVRVRHRRMSMDHWLIDMAWRDFGRPHLNYVMSEVAACIAQEGQSASVRSVDKCPIETAVCCKIHTCV